MVYYAGRFYWISQGETHETITMEDIDQGVVYHNDMFFEESHFAGLNVWHPTAQPVPGTARLEIVSRKYVVFL